MQRRLRNPILILAGLTLTASSLHAQAGTTRLTTPDARWEEGFSLVMGLRELSDGRVMVADPLGQALVVVDLDAGRADTIGRVGQGPEEYRQPDGVFPLPGDSTLLVDLGNARLTALGPNGEFGPTMPIAQGIPDGGPMAGGMMLVFPRAVDSRGRVYFQPPGMRPGGALPDSAPVVRFDRQTQTFDTVANVKIPELTRTTNGGANNRSVSIMQVPLSPQDGWAVAPDGRVALVRADGYYVEWLRPDGPVVRGPSVPHRPVRIGGAEKAEWAARNNAGLSIGMEVAGGQRRMSFRRGGPRPESNPDNLPWPEYKPPFDAGSVRIAPDGTLWVQRHLPAGSPPTFDLFDPEGRLVSQIELVDGRRLVGLGRGVVYTVVEDEYDLQYLERYRLPT